MSLTMLSACGRRALYSYRNYAPSRHASSTANPYPYPSNINPNPHQIFHLPRSATRADVKARYYELVRIYHPDSPVSRALPPETAQARFHAISAAYDALRGKTPKSQDGGGESAKKAYHNVSTAMWRAKQQRRAELNLGAWDDKWKDRLMLGAVFLTIGAFVAQTYSTRRQALQAAREQSEDRVRRLMDHAKTSDGHASKVRNEGNKS